MNPVQMKDVSSSNIESVGYSPEGSILYVQFKGSGKYEYHGVAQDKYEAMMSAPSVGTYFHQHIKPVVKKVRKA